MATPARFPSGIATQAKSHPLGFFGGPDPAKWIVHFDDFLTFPINALTTDDYLITEVGDGSEVVATSGQGGRLLLTTAASDNDSITVQLKGVPFILEANKKAICRVRFQGGTLVGAATASAVLIGLTLADTSPLVTAGGVTSSITEGAYFFKPSDVSTVNFSLELGDAITAATIATLANDTMVDLAWVWNGVDAFHVYVNNVKVLDQTTLTNRPTAALTLTMAIQTGTTAAQTLTIDHVFVAVER